MIKTWERKLFTLKMNQMISFKASVKPKTEISWNEILRIVKADSDGEQ